MRVAILNRSRAAYPGGDLVAIDATIAALGRIGVHAEYMEDGWQANDLKRFDLAHLYHCNFSWSLFNAERCWETHTRYVVTPVFYPDFWQIDKSQVQMILDSAEIIAAFSNSEMNDINEFFPVTLVRAKEVGGELVSAKIRVKVIPNGTDRTFHAPNAGPEREGVLCVAARQGDKNTDSVAAICKDLGLPFTLATGIPHEQMPGVYKRHRVFVNASDSERMSLTIGEALCAGCRVLATKHNRGNEWYPGLLTFDPDGWNSALIHDSHEGASWNFTPNDAARRLTWDVTAEMLKKVYEEALR